MSKFPTGGVGLSATRRPVEPEVVGSNPHEAEALVRKFILSNSPFLYLSFFLSFITIQFTFFLSCKKIKKRKEKKKHPWVFPLYCKGARTWVRERQKISLSSWVISRVLIPHAHSQLRFTVHRLISPSALPTPVFNYETNLDKRIKEWNRAQSHRPVIPNGGGSVLREPRRVKCV